MIKAPSIASDYSLIYSGDPALSLPGDDDEAARLLEIARDTGQWSSLITGAEQPTTFHMRPLYGEVWNWFAGECSRRNLVQIESFALAFRLALRSVDNLGSLKVQHTKADGHSIATIETLNAIYAAGDGVGRAVVEELASLVILKAMQTLRPKS